MLAGSCILDLSNRITCNSLSKNADTSLIQEPSRVLSYKTPLATSFVILYHFFHSIIWLNHPLFFKMLKYYVSLLLYSLHIWIPLIPSKSRYIPPLLVTNYLGSGVTSLYSQHWLEIAFISNFIFDSLMLYQF